jgi:flagellar motor switch protein FliM
MTDTDVNHCPASPAVSALTAELARRLCSGLDEALHTSAQTQAQPPRWAGPDEMRLAEPSCQFELSASGKAGAGPACLELSPSLADAMIDLVLGGSPQPLGHRRQGLTAVDRQLLAPVVERIVASCNDALADWPLKLEFPDAAARDGHRAERGDAGRAEGPSGHREESGDAHPAMREQKLLDLPIRVQLGECTGLLRLLLGANLLGLPEEASSPAADTVKLVAAIQETGLYVHDISNLAKGDLLVTDASAGGEVIVTVNGKPRFAGQLGQYNGHRAVTITRKLD